MEMLFVGHVAKDINKTPRSSVVSPGGGVFYGSIAAQRLGIKCRVISKCAEDDRHLYNEMFDAGVHVSLLPSHATTTIENFYPTDNPDDRISRVLSLAEPFCEDDVRLDDFCETIVISALWYGEFPEYLIPLLRERAKLLAGDAQGFLRNVSEDGRLEYRDWQDKQEYLGLFDVFKVDNNEAFILTNERDLKVACREIHRFGARIVLATHRDGVCAYDGDEFYEASFSPYSLAGRTGRGDTCLAAFLAALLNGQSVQRAIELAAKITSAKMQYAGPYRGGEVS